MVSEAALARKQRFMDLKKQHGGNVAGVKEHYENLKWNVWHEDDGTIVSMSKEDNERLNNVYNKGMFTNEQVEILKDKNWNLYRIEVDKHNQHVKYIQVRPVEIDKVSTEEFFLFQVDNQLNKSYDIKLTLSRDKLTIAAHASLIKKYTDVDLKNAIINGRKIVPFYITSKNDPSFMFHHINIHLEELITDKKVVRKLPSDFRGCSVFTLKLFEKYNFVEEKK